MKFTNCKTLSFIFSHFVLGCLLATNLVAQVYQEWAVRYNESGNSNEVGLAMVVDGSGNVYVAGTTDENGTSWDCLTIKYNSSGVQQWIAEYSGPGNYYDNLRSIAVDGSGNVYVTGFTNGDIGGGDYVTIKYNSSGTQQWVATYDGPSSQEDKANAIAVDGSGNVYVTGSSHGNGTAFDYYTIKYNSNGVKQWGARYNGSANTTDEAWSMVIDGSGNVYVTGGITNSTGDFGTVKYNSSGVQQWVAIYDGPANSGDNATSMSIDASSNIYVTGPSDGNGTSIDYATIKYNSSGIQQWVSRYDGPVNGVDVAKSIVVDGSGNVYVTGNSEGNGTNYDYATIKYNSSGRQQWVARYNGPGNSTDWASFITIDHSGNNVYVTGFSIGSGMSHDYATIKYNSAGTQQWVMRYNESANYDDDAYSVAVNNDAVYVTGVSWGSSANDCATIKYKDPADDEVSLSPAKPVSNLIPLSFKLCQNYPNPFNPSTKIRFDLPTQRQGNTFVKLVIYDILGREISELVNQKLDPGTYEVEWNAANYPAGVYYYRINAGDYTDTEKMVLIK